MTVLKKLVVRSNPICLNRHILGFVKLTNSLSKAGEDGPGESQVRRLGRSICEARSVFVLRLWASKTALKVDTKLECGVNVDTGAPCA